MIALSGKAVAWLTVVLVLLTFAIVVLRYGFNLGWIWLQESLTYLHVLVFSVVAAWTLQKDGHVRVDIFYQRFTPKQKAWVDALGYLILLLPFCIFLLVTSWHFFLQGWYIREGSPDPGGLPYLYLLKGFLPLASFLLLLQGIQILLYPPR